MSKKNQISLVTVMNQTNLPAVPSTLDLLKEELKGLKAITETQYKTEGNVEGFPTNIQSETKIDTLIKMWSSISGRAASYNAAQLDLGVSKAPTFKIANSTSEAFKHDIQLRMAVIKHADRKNELDTLVKEGEQFLTKEDQYKMYLAKVAKATKTV